MSKIMMCSRCEKRIQIPPNMKVPPHAIDGVLCPGFGTDPIEQDSEGQTSDPWTYKGGLPSLGKRKE